jgi:hypothetical protein
MSNETSIQERKRFIRRIEKILVRWITPRKYTVFENEHGEWQLQGQGFGSDGVLYVQHGTISWNSPKILIWRDRDNFRNFWGIWKKRFNLWILYPYSITKVAELSEFNSRIVHNVLKKTKTREIKLFGDI